MKVVFIEPAGAGGIAHYTYCLAKALAETGVECEIVTSRRWNFSPLPAKLRVYHLFRGIKTNPIQAVKLAWHLRRSNAIIHWQGVARPQVLLALMRLAPFKQVSWVYTVHNVLPHEVQTDSIRTFEMIYQKMQGLIFHTRHSQNQFERHFSDIHCRKAIIPHGEYSFLVKKNTKSEFSPVEGKKYNLLFFGNIRPYKGLDVLLEAIVQVKENCPKVKLTIAGQPLEPFDRYQALIEANKLNQHIEIRLGYIPDGDIPELFHSANIVVLPYRDIDQSGVLLLALAMGNAVVATNVGGMAEVIKDGETGLLVSPNDVEQLTQAIIHLLKDPQKAKRLGQAGKEDVIERFSWDSIAKRTIDFYQSLSEE